jgi:UDP-N-acetylmuramyl pentapeptide phosphotransferase/UDP-N-acetylglucosamine-1-phosphate transferase
MPVRARLIVHVACGIAVALFVNQLAPVPGPLNLAWLAWWLFWTVSSINIVNFMDGIDGMVACQGIVYGIFLFAISPANHSSACFGLTLAASCFGFLMWNWAPAKIFLGDVGSGPLGLFFVIGGELALESAPAIVIFLPLFPLYFDALVTLVRRFRREEKLTAAHRSHLYQRLANGGAGHALVTSFYALAGSLGALIGLTIRNASTARISVAIIAYCLVIAIAWKVADSRSSRLTANVLLS